MDTTVTAGGALVRAPHAVLSHQSAARQWGIELVEDGDDWITIGRNYGRYVVPGWRIRRSDIPDSDIVLTADGLRVTTVRRTLRDLLSVLPLAEAVAAIDSALRQDLVSPAALAGYAAAQRGPGSPRLSHALVLADPRSGSVLESLARVQMVVNGLLGFRTQYVIRDGRRFVARVDFCWPGQRLVVELDGFAFHSDREHYRRDRERMNQLERLGWRVLRFTWEDVRCRPTHVVSVVRDLLGASVAA